MSEVTRYDIEAAYPIAPMNGEMCEYPDGDYVLHSDYEALESEVKALRGVVEKVRKRCTDRLSIHPQSPYQEGKHDEANGVLSILPEVPK